MVDPTYPTMNHNNFNASEDWTPSYGDVKEAILAIALASRGKKCYFDFFDADHAGNLGSDLGPDIKKDTCVKKILTFVIQNFRMDAYFILTSSE